MPTIIDALHPDAADARATDDPAPLRSAAAEAPTAPGPVLAAFRAGRSEMDRTVDLLAFAIAAERGLAPAPDSVEQARRAAESALSDYSLRYLHNTVEQIRQEAVLAHLGRLRPPAGFLRLLLANLFAIAIAAAASAWAWSQPDIRAAAARLLGN